MLWVRGGCLFEEFQKDTTTTHGEAQSTKSVPGRKILRARVRGWVCARRADNVSDGFQME
jgi:hypothetical protein